MGLIVTVGGAVRVGLRVGDWDRVGLPVGTREGTPVGLRVLGAGEEGLDGQRGGYSQSMVIEETLAAV